MSSKLVVGWNPNSADEVFAKFVKAVFKHKPEVVIDTFSSIKLMIEYSDDKNSNALYQLITSVDTTDEGAKNFNKFMKKAVIYDNIMSDLKVEIFSNINKLIKLNEINFVLKEIKDANKALLADELGKIAKKFYGKPTLQIIE